MLFMVRSFFLLIHFLVVEDYELSKRTIFIYLFFSTAIVSLMLFCVRLLSEVMILLSTHHMTNHLSCCYTKNIRKCNSASNYIFIFVKLFHIFKLIHIKLKLRSRILIASFLLRSLLNDV